MENRFDNVIAFHTINLSFLGKPVLANSFPRNALVIVLACPVLDSTSWLYLCGPALKDPKCLYCCVIPKKSSPKIGCWTGIDWLPAVKTLLTVAAPVPWNCKRTSVFPLLSLTSMPRDAKAFPDFSKTRAHFGINYWEMGAVTTSTKSSKNAKIGSLISCPWWIDPLTKETVGTLGLKSSVPKSSASDCKTWWKANEQTTSA